MDKEKNIKEKFKQALISTFKVISEDFELKNNDEMRDIQSRKILLEFTKTWEWSYGTKKIHDITEFRGIRKQWLNVYSEEEKNNELF